MARRSGTLVVVVVLVAAASVRLFPAHAPRSGQAPQQAQGHSSSAQSSSTALELPFTKDSRQAVPTVIRLIPDSAHANLTGNGFLYLRHQSDDETLAARRVDVREWTSDVSPTVWPTLVPVAVLIDGVPMKALSIRPNGDLPLAASDDVLLDVVSNDGTRLNAIGVALDPRESFAGAQEHEHPGIIRDTQKIVTGHGSPVWINAKDIATFPQLYWVGEQWHGYRSIELCQSGPRFVCVTLPPAGGLEIRVSGLMDARPYCVNIAGSNGQIVNIGSLPGVSFSVNGVEPGSAIVSLAAQMDPEGTVYDEVHATVEAGRSVGVVLEVGPAPVGRISGDVRLPRNLPRGLLDSSSLGVVLQYVVRPDGSQVSAPHAAKVDIDSLHHIAGGESTYLWDFGHVATGGYRVEVTPFGYVADAWVDPEQSTLLTLAPPELSVTHLRFTDAESTSPMPVQGVQATMQMPTHGRDVAVRLYCVLSQSLDEAELISVPGRVLLQVQSETCGTFYHHVEVLDGTRDVTVPMAVSSWIDIVFLRDLTVPDSGCKWYGKIEVWQGSDAVDPMWEQSSLVTPNARKVSLCLRGGEELELRFVPDEGYAPISPVHVGRAFADSSNRGALQRREVRVKADAAPKTIGR